jgi:3-oxoacyl-[acyl-carrier protein] reductase
VGYVGNRDGALRVAGDVRALGRRAGVVQVDQSDPAAPDLAVEAAVGQLGRLDVLVNNAAWNVGIPFPDLDQITVEVWDRIFHTNVRGPFQLARAAAPHLRRHRPGRIVNIASVAGLVPSGSSLAYASSKAALIHLTRCLAVALAPDVTVNCIAPGLVEGTRMAQRIPADVTARIRQGVALGRTADAADIAEQVVTFCRLDSVTGQVLVVDGGMVFH